MRKLMLIAGLILLFNCPCPLNPVPCTLTYANNLRVENAVFYKAADQPAGTVDIKFDVIWDNPTSGTDGNSAAYFDRAWIFVKFWDTTAMGDSNTGGTGGAYPWGHAILTTGGSLSTYSQTTNTGLGLSGAVAVGAFAQAGTNQTVRWNYAATLIPGTSSYVASTDTVKVRVMAAEMCYIPQGSFYAGDGTTASVTGQFSTAGATTPFQVTSEGAITLGPGGLGNRSHAGMATADDFTDTAAPTASPTNLPDNTSGTGYPKGYHAFYLMKYEITEKQYVDFLNTLTRKQQKNRVVSDISADSPASGQVYVMVPSTVSTYRNTITCPASGNGTTPPITFSTARPYRACNYLSWMDVCAFGDWAGLRPMTELEFEKACRGGSPTSNVVADEGAWGGSTQTTAVAAVAISGTEDGTETITTTNANCNFNNVTFTGGDAGQGPLRAGIFAKSGTTRTRSGASCYGGMDLSGSLWERPVTVGIYQGRNFIGSHGDGTLTINTTSNTYDGCATNTDWPGYATNQGVYNAATGSGFRGGSWYYGWTLARVSDRSYAASVFTGRDYTLGGRCSRTSP